MQDSYGNIVLPFFWFAGLVQEGHAGVGFARHGDALAGATRLGKVGVFFGIGIGMPVFG